MRGFLHRRPADREQEPCPGRLPTRAWLVAFVCCSPEAAVPRRKLARCLAGPRASSSRPRRPWTAFIADTDNSLAWLFAVEHDEDQQGQHEHFLQGIGILVKGATTYERVLREADLLAHPEKWHGYYGDRPTFVFTTRELPRPAGVDVRFMAGRPEDALAAIRAAAAGGDIWRVGGGDLAGSSLTQGPWTKSMSRSRQLLWPPERRCFPAGLTRPGGG